MYLRLYSLHVHTVHTCMDTHKQTHSYSFTRKAPAALQLYIHEPQHHSELQTLTITLTQCCDTQVHCTLKAQAVYASCLTHLEHYNYYILYIRT